MMRRLAAVGLVTVSWGLGVACNMDSNIPKAPDAAVFDAKPADAKPSPDASAPDAGTPDAGPTFSGTVGVHDIQLLTATADVDLAKGHGGQIDVRFGQDGATPTVMAKSNKNHSGGLAPCFASYSEAAKIADGLSEGTVKLTVTHTNASAGVAIPDCTFLASKTYRCLSPMQGTGMIADASGNDNPAFVTLTADQSGTMFDAANIGRYLLDVATGAPFAITGASGTNQLGLVNVGGVPIPFTSSGFVIAAGIGPVPATTNVDGTLIGGAPDFLVDGDKVKVEIAGGTGVPAYTTSPAITAGEHLVLNADTKTLLSSKLDLTKALTFGLDKDASGQATGIVVVIDATDADTFKSDTDMGTPKKYSGSLTCSELGAQSVTIEADILNVIAAMNPTKIRISIFWDGFDANGLQTRNLSLVAGHGLVQFQKLQ
jgi:hypothetical protein